MLALGVGDDAAALTLPNRSNLVVSCDWFIEGAHFLPGAPPDSVGYKALVRAASDLAAMGAQPGFFLMNLALPESRTGLWLTRFLRGMRRAARELGMRLIGGDTTRSRTVALSITVFGQTPPGEFIARSGAKPGDAIYVSGPLGGAKLALELLRRTRSHRGLRNLLRPYLYPVIHTDLGVWLRRNRVASAMMDISDGLSTDLARLCLASRAGARLWIERIPCVQIPPAIARQIPARLTPLEMALNGGDDYELLFTVPPRAKARLRRAPGFAQLTQVGEITPGRAVTIMDQAGEPRILKPRGWDPFR